ncbi:MAG: hypothetical protein ACRDYZ_04565 [Acidimicrobiales bacterium]
MAHRRQLADTSAMVDASEALIRQGRSALARSGNHLGRAAATLARRRPRGRREQAARRPGVR